MIWHNYQYVEKCGSDLVDLPVPVIWKRICLSVEECANDLAESPVC